MAVGANPKSRLSWFSVHPDVNIVLMQPHSEQLGGGEAHLPCMCWKQMITSDAAQQLRGSYI